MRPGPGLVAALLLGGCALGGPGDLGRITFPTSGAPPAQAHFLRGVLLLHSFEYEDARDEFRRAHALDPGFVMAYWGEAMTHTHPLWLEQDRDAGRAALARLAPTPEARAARAPTARERAYLGAVEHLYGEGNAAARDRAYLEAMQALAAAYPDDQEAASFAALALLGAHAAARDVRASMQAAALAEEVFRANPRHPGAAHYLIHAYDDPDHAPLGLRPARAYARIAPAAGHALHMPSHIYLALGLWDDVVVSNEAAYAAADARVRRRGRPVDEQDFHALWWLEYGYLQQGRRREAGRALERMEAAAAASRSARTRWYLGVMRAAYRVEVGAGDGVPTPLEIADLGLRVVAADLLSRGLDAARRGDLALAERALEELAARRRAPAAGAAADPGAQAYTDTPPADREAAAVMTAVLDAAIRRGRGQLDDAGGRLAEAAAAANRISFEYGPPVVVKPARELLGEVLLQLRRPAEARDQFARTLRSAPGRTRALLGLARAAAASGDRAAARQAARQLMRIWHRADPDWPDRADMAALAEEPG